MSCERNDGFQPATADACAGAVRGIPARAAGAPNDRAMASARPAGKPPDCHCQARGPVSRLPLPERAGVLQIATARTCGRPPNCHRPGSRGGPQLATARLAGQPFAGGRPATIQRRPTTAMPRSGRPFLARERETRREKHYVVAAATLLATSRSINSSLATGTRQPMNLRKLLSS